MSKFLYVYGKDYAALDFKRNYNVQEIYQEMIKDEVLKKIIKNENHCIEIEIKEFGEIDDEFINFVQNELRGYGDDRKYFDIFEVK